MRMGRLATAYLAILLLSFPCRASDTEICQPWVKESSANSSKLQGRPSAPIKQLPPTFSVKKGGDAGHAIVFLGDSLTQGAGVSSFSDTFPMQVLAKLRPQNRRYEIYAIGGQTSTTLRELFIEETIPKDSVMVIWIGRNNDLSKPNVVIDDINRVIQAHSVSRFIILSILRGRYKAEQPGEGRYLRIVDLNRQLKSTFGENYVDVSEQLNCNDRVDNIHLNSVGYSKIAAAVTKVLLSKSW